MSQLALHTSKTVLCARLQAVALHFSRKTFHHLAPPNLTLARLRSLAITLIRRQLCTASLASPTPAKKRNAPLTIRGFATPTHLAHAHMQRKETYFAPPIPKALCQRIMPPRSMVSTHKQCVRPGLGCSPEFGWFGCSPPLQANIKGGIVNNHMRPCHHCSNSKTSIYICCW